MRVIIGSGKVASVLKQPADVVLGHDRIEVTDRDSIAECLSEFPPGTVVVNTAAKISLEWCETNRSECAAVNTLGAVNVADVCNRRDFHMVHVSSGCIFDGMETERVFSETDAPVPAAWYAESKAEADRLVLQTHSKVTVIRPRQLISPVANPTNMLTKFIENDYERYHDAKNSITCIEDMAAAIVHLVDGKFYGIYNVANEGWTTPLRIAMLLKETVAPQLKVTEVSYSDYLKNTKIKRVNTLLDTSKLKSTGFVLRTADEALRWCVDNYKR